MTNAIIVHGKPDKEEEYYNPNVPSPSNCHWFPWLQKQLLIHDIQAQTPEMPAPYAPVYEAWRDEFERYDIGANTVLVGHSCGGGFLLRWLSETKTQVGRVVVVAPSLGLNWRDRSFFDYTIDADLATRSAGLTIFGSDDDKTATKQAIKQYRDAIHDAAYREFLGYGHFTEDRMGTTEFPELLHTLGLETR